MRKDLSQHGGNITEEARRLGFDENELIDASASIVPFSLPKQLYLHLIEKLKHKKIRNYPDRNHTKLCEEISTLHKVEIGMVLPGNGASELFTWAGKESSLRGISSLPTPGFEDYARALNCWEAKYTYLPLPLDWKSNSPQKFPLQSNTDIIWITNPHNPTGQLWSRQSLEDILKDKVLVICDEAFLPLVPNGERESLIPLTHKYQNLVVIRSLTKLFGIAGLRLGYAISNPARLSEWQKWRDPWPLNTIAISAGEMLLSDHSLLQEWTKSVNQWISEEGNWLYKELNKISGIHAYPSSSNFILIKGENSLTSMREKLARKKILLRDCRSFKGLNDNYLRISYQEREGNIKIIEALSQFTQ